MPKKTHIQKLFDQINGGDDVDAAEEAQEIAEELLRVANLTADSGFLDDVEGDESGGHILSELRAAIAKAEGRHP